MLQVSAAALSVTKAQLSYGSQQALAGVTLNLQPSEILGLLGPNGAGKTSLIQCLAGRRQLDSGQITCHVDGAFQDLIGVVPQSIALYQDLTVLQNLDAFARFHGLSSTRIKETAEHSLEWSGLEDKRRAMVRTLSGGMQRRLNILCGVLHKPKILLLDEPTVGVDPQSKERIYDMLESLMQDGTAILLATHHLEEAQNRCDRIAIMDQGQIVATGTVDELVARTVGQSQLLQLRFSSKQSRVPTPLVLADSRMEATCGIKNASRQLPRILAKVNAARIPLENLSLRNPSLQLAFLQLTGREPRE